MTEEKAQSEHGDVTPARAWLTARIPAFAGLTKEERDAIADFTFLWSLFEARVLANQGSIDAICRLASRWQDEQRLDVDAFDSELAYLRERYWDGDAASHHFDPLRIKDVRHATLVLGVLAGRDEDPGRRMTALLVIIFRYRNNLFHGEKWQYGLQDQRENFLVANRALIKLLDRYGDLAH